MKYKNAEAFIAAEKVVVEIENVASRPDKLMTGMYRHFKCKLSRKGGRKSMTVYFSQGSAHTKPPTPAEVVDCIIMDAPAADMDFHEFCDEYGYDDEDKKALRIHRACVKQTDAWLRVFDEIPDLEQGM